MIYIINFKYILKYKIQLLGMLVICLCLNGCQNYHSVAQITPRLEPNLNVEHKIAPSIDNTTNTINWSKSQSFGLATKTIISAPLISNNILYIADDKGYAYAYDTATFKLLWQTLVTSDANPQYRFVGFTIDRSNLWVTNGSQEIFLLDAMTGDVLSITKANDSILTRPTVTDAGIFIVTADNGVVMIDKNKMRQTWFYRIHPLRNISSRIPAPLIYKNNVIACLPSGHIVGYKIPDGQLVMQHSVTSIAEQLRADPQSSGMWKPSNMPDTHDIGPSCNPLLYLDNLYVASNIGILVKLPLGSIVSQAPSAGQAKHNAKAMSEIRHIQQYGNTIFIVNGAMQLAALTPDLEVIWIADLTTKKNDIKRPFQALEPLWINGHIVVGTHDGILYTVDCYTGKIVNTRNVGSGLVSYHLHNNKLYLVYKSKVRIFESN